MTQRRWTRALRRTAAVLSLGLGIALVAGTAANATAITSPGGGESFDLHPGDTFKVGYDFTIPGNNQAVTVKWANTQAVLNVTCPGGGTAQLPIPLKPDPFITTVTDSSWVPSGDQHDPSVYQGVVPSLPALCGDGVVMHQNGIAVFTANVTSNPAGVKINFRFHDAANNASGSWSSTNSVVTSPITQTIQGEIFKCGSNGLPTTTLVNGGSITVPSANLSSPNPLPATNVAAGTYTMNATAPSGVHFVACGQSGVTIPTPGTANQSVNVPVGGHGDGKFYVTANTPPPPPKGSLEVCEKAANGTFQFRLSTGQTISVPAGSCSQVILVPPPSVTIVQIPPTCGGTLTNIAALPSSRLQSANLATRTGKFTIVSGGVSTQTIAIFTNTGANCPPPPPATGQVKVCSLGASHTFTITGTNTSGAAVSNTQTVPSGFCSLPVGLKVGTNVHTSDGGAAAKSITVAPSNRTVAVNPAAGTATAVVGSGTTEITYQF